MNASSNARRRFTLALSAGVLGPALGNTVVAQEAASVFPTKPIRFVVPFPAGSGTDATARIFAKKIGDLTGQNVVVENRPGGNGFIGVRTALAAPADGYTVFVGSNSTLSTNAATFRNLPYDPLTDFAPITLLMRGPCLIIVSAGSPYRSLKDLIDDARNRPGMLNYGAGSISYTLYTEWLNELTGIRTNPVPYKGASEAVNGVMSETVDFAVVDASTGPVELIRGGRVRALAYTSPTRLSLLPDVPTTVEAGVPELLAYNWVAVAVSAKTPPAIAQRLHQLFADASKTPELQEYFKHQSAALILSSPTEMLDYQREEINRWRRLVDLAKIPLQ